MPTRAVWVYCLSPRAKAIKPIRPEGRGITILKPTTATRALYYGQRTSFIHNHSNYYSSMVTDDVIQLHYGPMG